MEKKVWVLIDDRAGSNGQARGVAQALGWPSEEKTIVYNRWAALPNFIRGISLIGVDKDSRQQFKPPFPDLVISASRRTAPVALWIKKKSANKTKVVQLMHPGSFGLSLFDKVFVPEHDKGKKECENIFKIVGCAHRITPSRLKEAYEEWMPKFSNLPKPLTAVIVGGAIKGEPFRVENAEALAQQIKEYKRQKGGSILITTSRRTGELPQKRIMEILQSIPSHTYLWGQDKGDNPYLGYLACADDIVVTGDSVSMCCEACGTGKKVMIFKGENWLTPKHNRFVASLLGKKFAQELSSAQDWSEYTAYDPSGVIAQEIKKLF